MILIYLPRPINSHNTIMRKGRLAVVFFGSIFPKTLKMHSQVKYRLTEPLYLLTLRLFDIFISNNTHRLLVVSTTSCPYRAQNNGRPERSKSVQKIVKPYEQVPTLLWLHANGHSTFCPTMLRLFAWALH